MKIILVIAIIIFGIYFFSNKTIEIPGLWMTEVDSNTWFVSGATNTKDRKSVV